MKNWWDRPPEATHRDSWDKAVDEVARFTEDFDAPWLNTGPSNVAFWKLVDHVDNILSEYRKPTNVLVG
jgi:hypothetical protein